MIPVGQIYSKLLPEFKNSVKPGEVVSIRVIGRNGDQWKVLMKGLSLSVTSKIPLKKGMIFPARVSLGSGKLLLRPLRDPVQGFLQREEGKTLLTLIERVLLRSGMPLLPETISSLSRLFVKDKNLTLIKARLAAILADKNIFPGREEFTDLLFQIDGNTRYPGHGTKDRGKPRSGKKEGERDKEEYNEISQAFAKEFKSGLNNRREGGSLPLINHLRGKHGHWVIVPYGFSTDLGEIKGSLRLLYQGDKVRRMAMTAKTDSAEWGFEIDDTLRGGNLKITCNNREIKDFGTADLLWLTQKAGNLGIKIDDTISEGKEFDGFTSTGPGIETIGINGIAGTGIDTLI
ncbi:MAG: hypothetical protein KAU17_06435 [Spirochaetales bacterium]|nr:hypothetical protein [Spirochaetales bacterium]